MVYTWLEIVKIEGSVKKARSNIKKGRYQKVSHGIYTDDDAFIGELEHLFVRYPHATLTLQSAFDYYDLSDYIPDKYYLATPYNSHTIKNDKVSQSYMSKNMMEIGRISIRTRYGYIYIFDKERMLVELFRLRVKLPFAYFLEIVNSYRSLKANDEISFQKISDYCLQMRSGERLLREIQEMI